MSLTIPALKLYISKVDKLATVGAPGLVNFITAVAYHFCPGLLAAFTQPGASTLSDLCALMPQHAEVEVSRLTSVGPRPTGRTIRDGWTKAVRIPCSATSRFNAKETYPLFQSA